MPIGGYSHMTILADEAGQIWGGFDYEFGLLGDSLNNVIQNLLVDQGPPTPLDRRVPRG
ncbi:hypothetical protein J5X84_28380 [Streptosporangiaceae bacterium NEAU-GS5]|nr:hypothetical protein [Streptosporangiaceae bacterium NEAU-GS5]